MPAASSTLTCILSSSLSAPVTQCCLRGILLQQATGRFLMPALGLWYSPHSLDWGTKSSCTCSSSDPLVTHRILSLHLEGSVSTLSYFIIIASLHVIFSSLKIQTTISTYTDFAVYFPSIVLYMNSSQKSSTGTAEHRHSSIIPK